MPDLTQFPQTSRLSAGVEDVTATRGMPTAVGELVSVGLLDRPNPAFVLREKASVDLRLLAAGGEEVRRNADRFLHRRPKEDSDVYNHRVQNFVYENVLDTALGWYASAMFKTLPDIRFSDSKGNELPSTDKRAEYYIKDFLPSSDGNGTPFMSLGKNLYKDMLIYGMAYALVDLPAVPEDVQPQTRAEQIDSGLLRPMLRQINPLAVINWQCDKTGAYEWAVVKEAYVQQDFLGAPVEVIRWYYYDRERFYTFEYRGKEAKYNVGDKNEKHARLIATGQHCLSEVRRVPVVKLSFNDELWLANRVYLLLTAHLNQDNTLAWALFMSNLAIPVIIGDFDGANLTASENGYYQFPAGTTYQWTEPEGRSFVHSSTRLDSLREEIFRSMYLQAQGRAMHATPAMQSGRSKQLEMVPAHEVLQSMGIDLRNGLNRLLDNVAMAATDNISMRVHGLDFEDDMTTEEVFAVSSLMSLKVPSKTFEKYVYGKVASSWMRDASEDDRARVRAEIRSAATLEERQLAEAKKMQEVAAASMGNALKRVPPSSLQKPPGRGGAGPSPKKQ
jgi:hypothetical protein